MSRQAYDKINKELIPIAGLDVIDSAPTQNSTHAVSSGGVYSALHNLEINDLTNVNTSSLVDGQVLKYNGTSQQWENGTGGGSGSGGSVLDFTTTFASLFSTTITIICGDITETVTLDSEGKGTLDGFMGTGTVTVIFGTDNFERYFEVPYFGHYSFELKPYIVYGFHVNGNNSDPNTSVTYLDDCDNASFESAYMNYSKGVFDYGDWEDAFFMPKPCLLRQDGTVYCYLNPDDYTKDIDGNDVSTYLTGTTGTMNAMMEWGQNGRKIYYKIVNDESSTKSASVYIADYPVDEDFVCWSFYDWNDDLADHFYTPIYNGSVVSNVLRSISGKSILNDVAGTTEITYATANGTGWYTETLADRILINFLLILMGKSLDTQTIFGNGHYTGGSSASNLLKTGTMNTRGLFYGTNGTGVGVKVFGMENWWGNLWRRIAGWINVSRTQKIKLTYGTQDGSTVTGYNTTGTNYLTLSSATPSGTSGGYISEVQFNEYGLFPKVASGSSSTYYCDGLWFNNEQPNYAFVGGYCNRGLLVGAFCSYLSNAVSVPDWSVGAALSYHGNNNI